MIIKTTNLKIGETVSANIHKVVVNSLSAHVAILDEKGVIIETNRAWQEFGKNNELSGPIDCVGMNYLSICDQAGESSGKAAEVARGIRQVLREEIEEFLVDYPCHSPNGKRWFALRVVRYRSRDKRRVIVTHEDITPFIETQEILKLKEKELIEQSQKLEETNVALKVLLQHREEDRERVEESVVDNVNRLVLPYLEKLEHSKISERDKAILGIIESHLQDIISPFLGKISSLNKLLTPQEINVAALVREGRTSKEIAQVMNISVSAIDFHRKRLRKKLGLSNTGSNLRSYLLSLQ